MVVVKRMSSWRWGGLGLGMAGLFSGLTVGCGADATPSSSVCEGKLVADGQVCVLGTPITETGFECPPEMPFEYSGDHGGAPWAMCSSEDDLDAAAIESAMDEADGDDPNDPNDPTNPDDPSNPDDPTNPDDPPADADSDRVYDDRDNCPDIFNPDQADDDGDGVGDVCECWDADGDGACDPPPDHVTIFGGACSAASDCGSSLCLETDGGGAICTALCDTSAPCPAAYVCTGVDDGSGGSLDVCVPASDVPDPNADLDGDGIVDSQDNCPEAVNGDQLDTDRDGLGDACDDCLDVNSNRVCDDQE